jgi:hypothetical protein
MGGGGFVDEIYVAALGSSMVGDVDPNEVE